MNTHRAVIEYAVPPRLEFIASGDDVFCMKALAHRLEKHPLSEYDDDVVDSGGVAMVLEVLFRLDAAGAARATAAIAALEGS